LFRISTIIADKIFEQKDRLIALLPILFGIGIGIYFSLPFEPSLWIAPILAEILIILAYRWRFQPEKLFILAALGLIVIGFADIQLKSTYLKTPDNLLYTNEDTYIKGKITKIDSNYQGKKRIVLQEVKNFQDEPIEGTYRITLNHNYNNLKIGECIELAAQTFPLMHTNIVGGYQFDRKAYFEGINALGFSLTDAYPVDCTSKSYLNEKIKAKIYDIRMQIVDTIKQNMSPQEAAIASVLIAGVKDDISQKLSRQYQNSGLAHFLAISGLHMGMIAFLAFFFIRFIIAIIPPLALRYNSKKIAAITAIILSFIYFAISGMQIPAERAFIMTTVVLLGVLFNREAISLRTISLSAFIVLLLSPQALISASFQMSFAAVLVMTAFYESYAGAISRFFAKNRFYRYILGYLIGILLSDLVATIATLPFSIYHFHKIAIYTLIGNFLAAPIIGFIVMPCVLLSLLLLPFGLQNIAFSGASFGLEIINRITAYVSSLPFAGFKIIAMPFWGLLLIICGGLWLCVWSAKWRKWGIIPIAIGFLSILSVKIPDFITNAEGNIFAIKDNQEEIIVLPVKGHNFTQNMWLETLAQEKISPQKKKLIDKIYHSEKMGENIDNSLLDLDCDTEKCLYRGLLEFNKSGGVTINKGPIDTLSNLGFSAYIDGNDVKIKTVREYIGHRRWNK